MANGELRRAILESPYAGDIRGNRIFAESVCLSLLHRGINCFASHLYYPYFLDEHFEADRELGIKAGLQWAEATDLVIFALPTYRMMPTKGMLEAYKVHKEADREIRFGIFEVNALVAYNRHWLDEKWIIHPKGWMAALRDAVSEKVNG